MSIGLYRICKLWTESHLPSLKGNKAIDTLRVHTGTQMQSDVINTRPEPQLTVDPGVFYFGSGSKLQAACDTMSHGEIVKII